MKTSIVKGLNEEKKRIVTQEFVGSVALRDQLIRVLNEKISSTRKEVSKPENYSLGSWAYLQADAIGYERALNEIISLIS